MMKSMTKKATLFGLFGAVVCAAVASAAPSQIKFTNTNTWGQNSGGGPFEVQPSNFSAHLQGLGKHGAKSGRFLTFCVERNEYIRNNRTYDATINTFANNGGISGGTPDPLDERTAFLYTSFIKGTLSQQLSDFGADSVFTYQNGASGAAIQDAIWYLEGEKTHVSDAAMDLVQLSEQEIQQGGSWFGNGIGLVRILNLSPEGTTGDAQDQLTLIPLPIPVAMGLVGLIGAGVASRRRRKEEELELVTAEEHSA